MFSLSKDQMSNKNWGFHASVDTGWQGLHLWWSPAMLGIPMLVADSAWIGGDVVGIFRWKTIHALATISNKFLRFSNPVKSQVIFVSPFFGGLHPFVGGDSPISDKTSSKNPRHDFVYNAQRGAASGAELLGVIKRLRLGNLGSSKNSMDGLVVGLFLDQHGKGDSRDPQWWDPLMVSFPYHSHTIPISLGILMGLVWEAYQQGVSSLGVPENPTEPVLLFLSCVSVFLGDAFTDSTIHKAPFFNNHHQLG